MVHPFLRLSRLNLSMGSNSKDVKRALVEAVAEDVVPVNQVGRT